MSPTDTATRPRPAQNTDSRPRIDPRITKRRQAVTRGRGRRRLRILVAVLVLAGIGVLAWFLLHSTLFSAKVVTVSGSAHTAPAAVIAAAGLSKQPPLMDVNTAAAAAKVAQLPWVKSAVVTRHWPDGVSIAVSERVPALTMKTNAGSWAALDVTGRVLATATAPFPGLRQISGPKLAGPVGSDLAPIDAAGLTVAASLPPSFAGQVTTVTVEPGGWVQLAMTTPITVNIGSTSQLTAKYEDVTAMLSGATLHNGDVIDVSVPDAPTVSGP
jgi:cell division protein FtsQ